MKKAKIRLPKPTNRVVYIFHAPLPALPYAYVLSSSLLRRQFVSWGISVPAFYLLGVVEAQGLEDSKSEVWFRSDNNCAQEGPFADHVTLCRGLGAASA